MSKGEVDLAFMLDSLGRARLESPHLSRFFALESFTMGMAC